MLNSVGFCEYQNLYVLETNKSNNEEKPSYISPGFKQKLIAFSCYLSFGLTGLILIIPNFFAENVMSKYSFVHTFQSVVLAIISGILVVIIEIFTSFMGIFFGTIDYYHIICSIIYGYLPIFVFLITSSFAITALFGKNLFLPGIKKIAHNFVS